MPITGYISEAVAGGALLALWMGIRGHRKELLDKVLSVEAEALAKKDHVMMCQINTLEIKSHISNEIKDLGDTVVSKIDASAQTQHKMVENLLGDIKNNRKKIEKIDRRTIHLKD